MAEAFQSDSFQNSTFQTSPNSIAVTGLAGTTSVGTVIAGTTTTATINAVGVVGTFQTYSVVVKQAPNIFPTGVVGYGRISAVSVPNWNDVVINQSPNWAPVSAQ